MPKLTIDGIEVTVEPGTNLIEAALQVGKTIPHFCYHPKLSVAGNCRMCLVEVDGRPKPEIACNTAPRDGMSVRTDTEKLEKLRKGVLEFLFLNHPLDCPVCDKAGECKLQDYYLDHGKYVSRLEEGKVRKPKRLDIGNHIILDTERCVLCSRCVRFCDEITQTGELRIFERGAHSQIGTYPDRPLNNRYSICTTDVCPVGALTSKEFRFSARVWYLERAQSICGGCSNGCNIEAHHYKGVVKRLMPRRNDAVNDTWMCDDGRLGYQAVQEQDRLTGAWIKEGSSLRPVGIDAATSRVMGELRHLREQGKGGRIGVVLSPQASLEENYLALRVAQGFDARVFLVAGNPVGALEGDDDGFLIRSDKNPNSRGAQVVAAFGKSGNPGALMTSVQERELDLLLIVNNDVIGKAAAAGANPSVFDSVQTIVSLTSHASDTSRAAHVVLPLATWLETDGTWINHAGRVQRFRRAVNPPGEARAGWELLATLSSASASPREVRRPQKIFAELAQAIPALEGMSYESLGDAGLTIKAVQATAA